MKPESIRWRVPRDDVRHLSDALPPIRSYEEVALMLGVSGTVVRQLETNALRKIMRALSRLEADEKHSP